MRRGGSLVIVQATEDRVDDVADILGEHGAVDVDRRREHFEATGFSPHDTAGQVAEERAAYRIHDDAPSATRDVRTATRDDRATPAAEPRTDPPGAERRGARIYAPDAEGAPQSPIPLREPPMASAPLRRSDVAVEEIDVDDLDVRVTTPFGRRIPPPPPLARRTAS